MSSVILWRKMGLGLLLLLPAGAVLAEVKLNVQNRSEFLNYDVSGPGKAQSFYDPNAHIYHESDFQLSNFNVGGWDGAMSTTLRYTNSKQYDPATLSVQKFESSLKDAHNRVDMGDLFANLSPYSMMKGIKGVGFQHNLADDRNYIKAVYGNFAGQWAYVMRNARPDRPMDRYGGGVRLQRSNGNLTWGANLAMADDRSDDPNRGILDAYRQTLPALDWEYRNSGMVLSGEHAYSDTTVSPLAGTAQNLYGSANRVSFRGAYRTVSLDASLEQVTPTFVTLGGGSTPDRVRLFTRADWRMDRQWRLFGTYDRFYNSLDHQLATRTTNEIMEMGVTRQRIFDRRGASLTASGRTRTLSTENASSASRSDRIRLKYKDRFLNDAMDFGADYERMLNSDQRVGINTHLANNLYNLSFGYRGNISKEWALRTNLDFGKSEVQNPTNGGFDVMDTARLDLVASRPDSTELGASYNLGNNNATVIGSSSSQNRAMIFWSRRPQALQGGSVRVEGSVNDYRFFDGTRNYQEKLLRVVLNWNLENKFSQ